MHVRLHWQDENWWESFCNLDFGSLKNSVTVLYSRNAHLQVRAVFSMPMNAQPKHKYATYMKCIHLCVAEGAGEMVLSRTGSQDDSTEVTAPSHLSELNSFGREIHPLQNPKAAMEVQRRSADRHPSKERI